MDFNDSLFLLRPHEVDIVALTEMSLYNCWLNCGLENFNRHSCPPQNLGKSFHLEPSSSQHFRLPSPF